MTRTKAVAIRRSTHAAILIALAMGLCGCASSDKAAVKSDTVAIGRPLPMAKVATESEWIIEVAAEADAAPPSDAAPGTAMIIFDEEPPKPPPPAIVNMPTAPTAPVAQKEDAKQAKQKSEKTPPATAKKSEPPKPIPSFLPVDDGPSATATAASTAKPSEGVIPVAHREKPKQEKTTPAPKSQPKEKKDDPPKPTPTLLPHEENNASDQRVAKAPNRPADDAPKKPVVTVSATASQDPLPGTDDPSADDVWRNLSKSMERKGIALTENGKAVKKQPVTPTVEIQAAAATTREEGPFQPVIMPEDRARSAPRKVTTAPADDGPFQPVIMPPERERVASPQPSDEDDEEIQQAGCKNCGERRGLLSPHGKARWHDDKSTWHDDKAMWHGDGPCLECGNGCYPGRKKCHPIQTDTCLGRCFAALYECICCPDPCYEPEWLPIADSAFFVDSARPQTQTRIRYDAGLNVRLPDRAEYFWARSDGRGQGPRLRQGSRFVGETAVDYNDLRMYTEVGTGNIGIMTEIPYRTIDADDSPDGSGWADMMLGTKTLLCDCELLQIAFLFKTYMPVGSAIKGTGNGHFSLEPSLVLTVKLGKDTYFQGQLAEWIPIGADPDYAGSILHYHKSINHVLCRLHPDVPLIGTAEFNGWSFQDGLYTDPYAGATQKASGDTYMSAGGGLRLFICDKIDIGFGCAFALDDPNFAEQRYIFDFRWRY